MTPAWVWWGGMAIVSAVNWAGLALASTTSTHGVLFGLSCPFVAQCSWRCLFPCDYPSRRTFFDSPLNSVLAQRLMAAVGETCLGLQKL